MSPVYIHWPRLELESRLHICSSDAMKLIGMREGSVSLAWLLRCYSSAFARSITLDLGNKSSTLILQVSWLGVFTHAAAKLFMLMLSHNSASWHTTSIKLTHNTAGKPDIASSASASVWGVWRESVNVNKILVVSVPTVFCVLFSLTVHSRELPWIRTLLPNTNLYGTTQWVDVNWYVYCNISRSVFIIDCYIWM